MAHLVDTTTGEVIADLPGQTQRVTAVAVATDLIAVASGEPGKSGIVRVYSAKDVSKPAAEIAAHKDIPYALAFSPDGKTIATAGYDRIIKLWDTSSSSKPLRTLTDHSDTVYSLAWHKDGKLLASASADRTVKVWDGSTGKRLYTLSDPTDWVYTLAWSPDGRHLAAGGVDKSVRVWEANAIGGKLVHAAFAHATAVSKVMYSPEGGTLVTVGEDRVVKRWNAATLVETKTFLAQPEAILSAALRPDGKQLAFGTFDGRLQLIDPETGKATHTPLPVKPKPAVLTNVTPDGIQRGKTTRITITGQRLDQVNAIAFDRDGFATRILTRTPTHLESEITVPPSLAPGARLLRCVSEAGTSNDLKLHVDRYPAVLESSKTDSALTAAKITLPTTVTGSLDRAGDTDHFRFDAKAGQPIGVQLIAGDPKKLDATLSVSDDTGRTLIESSSGVLGFVAPKNGIYSLGVTDKEFRGGTGFEYRLHVGDVPVVTSVFPLGVQRGRTAMVHVDGVNLSAANGTPVSVTVPLTAEVGSKITVPVATQTGEMPLGSATVVVGEFPQSIATPDGGEMRVPGTADGILSTPGQSQIVKFDAKKGERLIVEVHASRLGSPLDSHLELLDANGKPLHRATLRCVAQTFVTFRDHDANTPGIRLETWNELRTNDYLYVGNELVRIKALPKNPDDDCQFVQVAGKRVGFLGTTPTHHPQNAPMYKVEFHPPHSTFPPNGMPVFPIVYRNDDGGDRYGKDSMIEFDPPETGSYQVKVSDARGLGGPTFGYRLTVRPPKPDFTLSVSPNNPAVWKNGGVPLTVTATRIDGYQGPIAVKFDGLPRPFTAPSTTIEAEQTSAVVTLFANEEKIEKPSAFRAIGTANIGGKEVVRDASGGTPALRDPGDLTTTTSTNEVAVRPGTETRLTVTIKRHGDFKDRVPLDVLGLPHGVKVQNIGLNGILVMPEQTQREIVLYAEPWVKPTTMPIVVAAKSERRNTTHAAKGVTLTVQP